MSRNSGASPLTFSPDVPFFGYQIPYTPPNVVEGREVGFIVGDLSEALYSFASLFILYNNAFDDVGVAAVNLVATDSTGALTGNITLNVQADGTAGTISSGLNVSDSANTVAFSANSVTGAQVVMSAGNANNGGLGELNPVLRYNNTASIAASGVGWEIIGEDSMVFGINTAFVGNPPPNPAAPPFGMLKLFTRLNTGTGHTELCSITSAGNIVVLSSAP